MAVMNISTRIKGKLFRAGGLKVQYLYLDLGMTMETQAAIRAIHGK